MNILITGTTGFIGSHAKHYLQDQGNRIIEVNRMRLNGHYTFDDVFAGKCRAEVWLHLAAKSKDIQKKDVYSEYVQANVELTRQVFEAFIKDDTANTFIFISSVKAAAASVPHVLAEGDELEADGPYGNSKRMAEQYLLSIPLPEHKKLVIVRPAMVYGYNKESNLYALYKFVKRGLPYPFAAFSNARTMVSIDNLLFVLSAIINRPDFKAGIYNIADDDAISTNQLIIWMAEALNKKPSLLKIPRSLIQMAGNIGDALHLPINTPKLKKLTDDYIVSNQKLTKQLGRPLPFKAEPALKALFKRFTVDK